MGMLPGNLLPPCRLREHGEPSSEPSVWRRELMGSHGLGPFTAGLADRPHDVGPLGVEILAGGRRAQALPIIVGSRSLGHGSARPLGSPLMAQPVLRAHRPKSLPRSAP